MINPMAEFVDVIHEKWWQGDAPDGLTIGRELSVVKAWLRQGWTREELLGGLALYDGPPLTLLAIHKRGNRGQLHELVGRWRKRRAVPRKATEPKRLHIDIPEGA